jgi:DNA-binding XRE family transcriptional regulator
MTIPELKLARAEFGLSQPAMAKALNISVHTYRHYEHGISPIPRWLPFEIDVLKRKENSEKTN